MTPYEGKERDRPVLSGPLWGRRVAVPACVCGHERRAGVLPSPGSELGRHECPLCFSDPGAAIEELC